jgi:hypothetical protein
LAKLSIILVRQKITAACVYNNLYSKSTFILFHCVLSRSGNGRPALVSGRCAGHTAMPLYRGVALDMAAPPLCRGAALVMPHRPCIGCSALVIGGASVYRGLCVVEKCQIFLQGIKRSEAIL